MSFRAGTLARVCDALLRDDVDGAASIAAWKMSATHMAFWELFPTIDHAVPVARGGTDVESNWVTTSMVRNAAKSNWTLEELGWTLLPATPSTEWDGLRGWFDDFVRAHPEHLTDPYLARWHRAAAGAGPDA